MDRRREIAYRYAKALFLLPGQHSDLLNRLAQLETICQLMKDYPNFKMILCSPRISHDDKKQFLNKCFANKAEPLLLQFFYVLIDNLRFALLDEITSKYKRVVYEKLGVIEVVVMVASPIDDKKIKKLIHKMEQKYQHSVDVKVKVQEEMLGGIKLIFDNKIINNSIKDRLSNLKRILLEVTV